MRTKVKRYHREKYGSVLILVVISLVILSVLGTGLLAIAYGVRHQAASLKSEAAAMLAAEAGYEKAIFWMSRQQDMLSALQDDAPGINGSISFPDGRCEYVIELYTFVGGRPVYKVTSHGRSGTFKRTVSVFIIQAISGWDMGMCRVPIGRTWTSPVYFANGEIIDMPLHINKFDDYPDYRDIYIQRNPQFLQNVAMGESRYTDGGSDKYASVIDFFDNGIHFDQPDSRITDEDSVQSKVDRFKESTDPQFRFTPVAEAPVSNPVPAVHLEFFVHNDIGKVRISNCTVRGFKQAYDSRTYDFRIRPGSGGTQYERYYIYAYHLIRENADDTGQRFIRGIEETYVTQSFGAVESEPGGQIYVDGNVIIGSGEPEQAGFKQDVVKGKITVVATGNIWIADSIVVDGQHDADETPSRDNPNVLGLIAQGVIRVVDPGMTDKKVGSVGFTPKEPSGFKYVPIARLDSGQPVGSHKRHLPERTIVEAAITSGGGGWGAENVRRRYYGGRKEASGNQDDLVVHGTIAEAIRGVVGLIGRDGYLKHYYLDERLLEGVLPGDIWLKGKYIPAPAGWHDYRPSN